MQRAIASAFFLWLLTMPAYAQETVQPAMPHNVMLIGWDGASRDHVKALLAEGKLPHLKHIINEGKLVDITVTSGATDTKAGWTQILTGYRPEVTGVYSNSRFRDVPAGYSIFERLARPTSARTTSLPWRSSARSGIAARSTRLSRGRTIQPAMT